VAVVFGGCGLEEGQSWGEVRIELEAAFEPGASRLEAGRLKTSLDYRVVITAIDVEVATLVLTARADGAVDFDPADPPAGYSLCHNGHCHSDDGRLVDYEDIAAEVAGGGDAPPLVGVTGGRATVGLGTRGAIDLSACGEVACEVLEPSAVGLVAAELVSVSVAGVAYDARTGPGQRLDSAGVVFEIAWSIDDVGARPVRLAAEGGWRFGPGDALGLDLMATIALPASLLDGVDFAARDDAVVVGAKVAVKVAEDGGLILDGRRFD